MSRLVHLDDDWLTRSFGRAPAAVRHELVDHPLLTHDALVELAQRLPVGSLEHHRGEELPLLLPDADAPVLGDDPIQIARDIETNGCWMVLWNIEQLPEYKQLLDDVLDHATALVGSRQGGTHRREGFIFLSAPRSITPAHIDPEHNFLLQVRGTKEVKVGSFPDPQDRQLAYERYYTGAHRNLDVLPGEAEIFSMGPGDGVYVPVLAPHWVHNGSTLCVSLSATFRTRASDRLERVHTFNARLRRLGLRPRPPQGSIARDRAKAAAEIVLRGISRGLRPSRAEPEDIYGPTGTRVK